MSNATSINGLLSLVNKQDSRHTYDEQFGM